MPSFRHSRLAAALLLGWTAMVGLASAGERDATTANITPALKISRSLSLPEQAQDSAPAAEADLWSRIRAGLVMPDAKPDLVSLHENWFANRQAYLNRAIERSQPYLYHIVEEVQRRGMPMEIALLPMIESAYNPQAVSSQNATGIWQFMSSTGRVYGLRQNNWYDGRRDVLAATHAALNYLQDLHRMFGDWQLALAAYNCGEGCVGRAISRNQARGLPTDYSSLDLPTETRHYVPKLIAVRNIVQDPTRFGLSLGPVANAPYFSQIKLGQAMEARQAAKLAGMSLEDFLALNPGFHRRVLYSDSPGVLLLPSDRVEDFHANLEKSGNKGLLQPYQAKRGELAHKIADRFGVTVEWLKDHNPLKLYKGKVANSQTLIVPAQARGQEAGKAKKGRMHTVRKGDTLADLAKRYKVRVSDIREFNRSLAEPLRPGETIQIPLEG